MFNFIMGILSLVVVNLLCKRFLNKSFTSMLKDIFNNNKFIL